MLDTVGLRKKLIDSFSCSLKPKKEMKEGTVRPLSRGLTLLFHFFSHLFLVAGMLSLFAPLLLQEQERPAPLLKSLPRDTGSLDLTGTAVACTMFIH